MSDERSTRRLINHSSGGEGGREATTRTKQDPNTSAAGEDQLPRNRQKVYSNQQTEAVRLQPPDSFDMDPNDSEGTVERSFDIDQLEEELSLAINAELGEPEDQAPIDADTKQEPVAFDATAGEKSDSDRPERNVVDTPPANQNTVGSNTVGDAPAPAETVQGASWLVQALMVGARPVEALSPRGRRLLEICAVSMAVWVPVVWLLVMTDGLGFLRP